MPELTLLSELGRRIGAAASLEAILTTAADAAMDVVAPDLVLLYVRRRTALHLVEVRPRRRAAAADGGHPHRVGECLCGLAAQSGTFTSSADIRHDPRCVRTECKRAGYTSFAAMPIHGSGGVVAVLGLAAFRRRDFGRKRAFIEAIGAQIGVAIENATLRRQVESRMEELELRLREQTALRQTLAAEAAFRDAVIDGAAEGLCVCHAIDAQPFVRFTVWNRRMVEITGYSMAEINRLGWYQTVYPNEDDRARVIRRMERMREGENLNAEEWSITARDGSERVLAISTRTLAVGGRTDVLAVMQDRTESIRLVKELRQAGRASTLGELAAQLAHELNQPLAAILTNAQSLKRMLEKRPVPAGPARDAVGAIVRDDKRAADVIRHLRGLLQGDAASAGRGRLRMEPIVRDVLAFLGGMLRTAKVEAVVRCGRRVPAVLGNRIEMTQVLVNLVRNAIESMESAPADGRRLTIDIRAADGGRTVAVAVADTGAGFPEQVLSQPFKPFRSTKAGGLGLGLSICRRILDAHGGRLDLGRHGARGATVSVVLPAARKEAV